MRLAFDATLDDEPTTGISLSSKQLALALEGQALSLERWGAHRSGQAPRRGVGRSRWVLERLPRLLEERTPELFHATANFNLPLQRVGQTKLVLTVHDAVPVLLPDTVSRAFRWQFRLWLARSLTVAHRVVFVSEAARRDVLASFEVDREKTSVVHHGVDHVFDVPPPDNISAAWLEALGLPETFVLYAGALDARKNVQLVLEAMERMFEQGRRSTLVLAGQRWFGAGAVEHEVQRLTERGLDVRPLGYLDERVFYALMRRAAVFVFPSRYEGFGLPPLEAMALGVPTIVSSAGSLPEVCGDGAMTVAPDDADDLARRLDALLGSSSLRESWSALARRRAAQFTWARSAAAVHQVYRSALASP